VVVAHGVVGLAIVALGPSKSVIARRGLRTRAPARTLPSAVLGVLVIAVIVTGLGYSTGLVRSFGLVTAMQVHVAAALASIPLLLWHLVARPVRPRTTDLSRRALVRSGAILGASALAYGGLAGLASAVRLPGADRRFTGSYEEASFDPERMPVTQWLDDPVVELDPSEWSLSVSSAGRRTWTLDELASFDDRIRATLDCTGGWYSTQRWDGVLLSRLFPDLGESESISVRSATGYSRRFPASDAEHLLLAVRLGGAALTPGQGAPARLVAPGRRGFWWVKWVTDIEATETPWWWQPPFPLT
jgi:Oxidoreductase molybdopterin binding domain